MYTQNQFEKLITIYFSNIATEIEFTILSDVFSPHTVRFKVGDKHYLLKCDNFDYKYTLVYYFQDKKDKKYNTLEELIWDNFKEEVAEEFERHKGEQK